jgi:hypothetical protein
VASESLPDRVTADFKTTVDETSGAVEETRFHF